MSLYEGLVSIIPEVNWYLLSLAVWYCWVSDGEKEDCVAFTLLGKEWWGGGGCFENLSSKHRLYWPLTLAGSL